MKFLEKFVESEVRRMTKTERKEITERVAQKFILLPEDGKAYVAGYIAGREYEQNRQNVMRQEVESPNVNKKPTINQLRKENGLSEISDGDIALTKV